MRAGQGRFCRKLKGQQGTLTWEPRSCRRAPRARCQCLSFSQPAAGPVSCFGLALPCISVSVDQAVAVTGRSSAWSSDNSGQVLLQVNKQWWPHKLTCAYEGLFPRHLFYVWRLSRWPTFPQHTLRAPGAHGCPEGARFSGHWPLLSVHFLTQSLCNAQPERKGPLGAKWHHQGR